MLGYCNVTVTNLNDKIRHQLRIVKKRNEDMGYGKLKSSRLDEGSSWRGRDKVTSGVLRRSPVEDSSIALQHSITLREKMMKSVELARLNKPPAGKLLVTWPLYWSMLLASPAGLPVKDFALVGILAVIISSIGCVINDLWDRDFDKKVERCKNRPLASGKLRVFEAGVFLMALSLVALASIYALHLNVLSCKLLILPFVLLFIYPLMKRITYWAQLVLGITANVGVFIGWSFVKGTLNYSVLLPMYAAGVFWTLIYDTIYAHQDKNDDSRIGLKSTAVLFGDQTLTWLASFNIAFTLGLTLTGLNAAAGWPYFVMVVLASIHVFHQIFTVDLDNGADCNAKFMSNQWVGAIIFAGILLDRYFCGPKYGGQQVVENRFSA